MRTEEVISKRFEELLAMGERLLQTRYRPDRYSPDCVNNADCEQWVTASLAFIQRFMTKESEYYERFSEAIDRGPLFYHIEKAVSVLRAAKSDFDGGFLFDTRRRIQAEVFDDFLEQAESLLIDGYFQVAAVIAGAVLEDGLRKLCANRSITLPPRPKLDSMNVELAKAGVYDKLVQKQVTWLADLRNKAAHGEWDKFKREDAEEMLIAVRRFMVDYLSK